MLKRLKKLGFLLILAGIVFLFGFTDIGKILGHWSLFYIGIGLIFLCFFLAIKIVGFPPFLTNFLKEKSNKIKKLK